MNVYCLYFPNGKRYVGVERRPGRRIRDHANMASLRKKKAQPVHVAIQKHGWENVRWRYLATHCTDEIGWQLEKFFVAYFRTQDRDLGYNRSEGGEVNRGVIKSADAIRKHTETRRVNGTLYPRELRTPEAMAKQIESRRKGAGWRAFAGTPFRGVNAGSFTAGNVPRNKGKPMSEESKLKMIETKRHKRAEQFTLP